MRVTDEQGIALRQNYNREAPRMAAQIGRYAHAKLLKAATVRKLESDPEYAPV